MSKNRNRAKLKKAHNSRDYNIILKNENLYCYICVRRVGSYQATCHPSIYNKKSYKYRENRTWKHNRKHQYK